MSIVIHTRKICPAALEFLAQVSYWADTYKKTIMVSDTLGPLLTGADLCLSQLPLVNLDRLDLDLELMISLGGDGTFLEITHYVKDRSIPLLGINTGNLGFLTMVNHREAIAELVNFFEGKYILEDRTLLSLHGVDISASFALNEIALLKRDTASLLTIDAYIDAQLITTYWADGLIIATATGSTAYSLSCSGPIMLPGSNSFVITPLSPHNLSVRPLVVPDTARLSFFVRGRHEDMIVSVDGRSISTAMEQRLVIEKAPFVLKLVRFGHRTIFDVLREKFYWGMDSRN